MPVGRRYQSSTLMPNGQILVDGGWNSPNTGLTFDVNTASFTASANTMNEYRELPTATLISNTETTEDGKVLLAGGAALDHSTKGAERSICQSRQSFFRFGRLYEYRTTRHDCDCLRVESVNPK